MGLKEITEDRTFNIAFGGNRRSTSWKNKEIKWPELVKKLSITKRTKETVEEYQKMTKEQKGDLKDIGGFVCGFIKDGRRRAENILSRRDIRLDHSPLDGILNYYCFIVNVLTIVHQESQDYALLYPLIEMSHQKNMKRLPE